MIEAGKIYRVNYLFGVTILAIPLHPTVDAPRTRPRRPGRQRSSWDVKIRGTSPWDVKTIACNCSNETLNADSWLFDSTQIPIPPEDLPKFLWLPYRSKEFNDLLKGVPLESPMPQQ